MTKSPDFVILLGARALTSLAGILFISIGNWRNDRQWDEWGSQATSASASASGDDIAISASSDYRGMEEGDTNTAAAANANANPNAVANAAGSKFPTSVKIAASKQLQLAFPTSYTAILGWIVLAVSHVFPRNDWYGLETNDVFVILSIVMVLMIGVVQTVAVRIAVLNREMRSQRIFFIVTLGLGFLIESTITDVIHPDAPFWMAPLGALCIALSPVIMWRTRKMGRSFEVDGRPSQSAVVYSFGGPLLVFGWFWLWMGFNAVRGTPDAWYLPVYLTTRTIISFVGAILVVVSLWMAGFALDESEEGAANGLSEDSYGLGVATYGLGVAPGIFFGKVSEVIIPVTIAWIVFGAAAFLPYFAGFWPILLFLVFIAQGVILSFVHQKAVRSGVPSGRPECLTKWNRISYLGFTVLVLLMFASGTLLLTWLSMVRAIAAVLGVLLFCGGQRLIQHDRKRGWHWMETSQVNPHPVMYSHGIPIFSLGVMLLAYAMTILP